MGLLAFLAIYGIRAVVSAINHDGQPLKPNVSNQSVAEVAHESLIGWLWPKAAVDSLSSHLVLRTCGAMMLK